MKKIISKVVIGMFILGIMVTPIYAASSSWGFTMSTNGRVVDGGKNGAFHTLKKGKVKISGNIHTNSVRYGNGLSTNQLNFELYNKTTGNCFGNVKVRPSGYAFSSVDFSGKYDKAVGGGTKYYLYIWRGESDGTGLDATGKLENQ